MGALISQDIEAILVKLRNDVDLVNELLITGIREDPAEVSIQAISHLRVNPGVVPPYIIVVDVNAIPTYAFNNSIVFEDGTYSIRCISQDTEDDSAGSIAGRIHQKIIDSLHNNSLNVNGFVNLDMKVGPREPYHWEEVSSEVSYLHSGFRWTGMFSSTS